MDKRIAWAEWDVLSTIERAKLMKEGYALHLLCLECEYKDYCATDSQKPDYCPLGH